MKIKTIYAIAKKRKFVAPPVWEVFDYLMELSEEAQAGMTDTLSRIPRIGPSCTLEEFLQLVKADQGDVS